MILTCPRCTAQFLVDSSAIPSGGREVRCASCKHQWHAMPDPEVAELTAAAPALEQATSVEPEPMRGFASDEPQITFDEGESDAEGGATSTTPPDDTSAEDEPDEDDLPPFSRVDLDHPPAPHFDMDADFNDPAFGGMAEKHDDGKGRIRVLMAVAAFLLLCLIPTSIFALRTSLQSSLGFFYDMIGMESSAGLVLSEVKLRERPARNKARYIVEGEILNESDETKPIPILRIAMISRTGEVMLSRRYEPDAGATLEPGETHRFRAGNIETAFKDEIDHLLVDIGNRSELMLRSVGQGDGG